ncbi:MAG: hypothetical protein Q7K45_01795, partial [Nanoarchaeota archaeon]|nr:hypothetical protein [Nanoarchaeota archaeon]
MGLANFLRVHKRKLIVAALLASFAISPKQAAAESAVSKACMAQSRDYYQQHLKGKPLSDWAKEERMQLLVHAVAYLKSLKRDIIQATREGRYDDARSDYDLFMNHYNKIVEPLGGAGLVNEELAEIAAIAMRENKILNGEIKREIDDVPDGVYTFNTSHLSLQLIVRKGRAFLLMKHGINVFDMDWKEWRIACQGKPKQV